MTDGIEPWARDYILVPFKEKGRTRKGADCWGLPVVIYADQAGIDLPHYADDYQTTEDREVLAALIARERDGLPFSTIAPRLDDETPSDYIRRLVPLVRPLDLLLLPQMNDLCHFGVAVGGGHFLTIEQGKQAFLGQFDPRLPKGGRWALRAAAGGIHRHRDLREGA